MKNEELFCIISDNQDYISNIRLFERDFKIDSKFCYLFKGSIRSGKSYCLFQIIKRLIKTGTYKESILYVNIGDERFINADKELLDSLICSFKERYKFDPIVFIDEVNKINDWPIYIRELSDRGYKVFASTSSLPKENLGLEGLLGEKFIIKEILTLSFKEYLKYHNLTLEYVWEYGSSKSEITTLFDSYFNYGAYPEILKHQTKRKGVSYLFEYVFYKELIVRYNIRNEGALRCMISQMARSINDELSYNKIKRSLKQTGVKIGTNTVIEYVNSLLEIGLIFGVHNFSSKIPSLDYNRKFYFSDNGIRGLFLTNSDTILLKNIVAVRLKRLYGDNVFYIRDNEIEIDFYVSTTKTLYKIFSKKSNIVEHENEIDSLVKTFFASSEKTRLVKTTNTEKEDKDVHALVSASKLVETNFLYIITFDIEKVIKADDKNILMIPIWKWLIKY